DKTFFDHWLLENDLKDYLQPFQHAQLNSVERVLLAQRLANEPARTVRHLNDLVRLLPSDHERSRMLYETALKAGELSMDRGFVTNGGLVTYAANGESKPTGNAM